MNGCGMMGTIGVFVATSVGVAGATQAIVPVATTTPPRVTVTTLPVPGVPAIVPAMTVMPACTTELLRVWVPSVVDTLSVATPPSGNPLNELLTVPPTSVMLTLPLIAPPTGVRIA